MSHPSRSGGVIRRKRDDDDDEEKDVRWVCFLLFYWVPSSFSSREDSRKRAIRPLKGTVGVPVASSVSPISPSPVDPDAMEMT